MRITVFTQKPLSRDAEIFIEKLLEEPGVSLEGILIDQSSPRLFRRSIFLIKRWGLTTFVSSVIFQIFSVLWYRMSKSLLFKWHDLFVRSAYSGPLQNLRNKGVRIKEFQDILSDKAVAEITSTESDLGVIIGGRILSDSIINWPRLGSLNIHKHDCKKYRGGAQIGYPECLNHDPFLTITIHYATTQVDSGDIVKTVEIPIEPYDGNQSLEIKANVAGFELYLEAIRDIRDNTVVRLPQTSHPAEVLFTTPYLARALLWRKRRKQHLAALQASNPLKSRYGLTLGRNILAIILLPFLAKLRTRLEGAGQAPIIILYYHGVSNSAENWMHLPLELFHEHVTYLRKYFRIIDIEEAVKTLRNGNSSELSVVLTFDDGYQSLHNILLPYLSYHALPATFFVCPEASSKNDLHEHDRHAGCHNAQIMSITDIEECANNNITIGSHGNNHDDMASLNQDELEKTMRCSLESLENMSIRPVKYFSFPFGHQEHISDEALSVAKKYFKAAFSAFGGYNLPHAQPQFLYNRISNPTDFMSIIAIANGMHRARPFHSGPSVDNS